MAEAAGSTNIVRKWRLCLDLLDSVVKTEQAGQRSAHYVAVQEQLITVASLSLNVTHTTLKKLLVDMEVGRRRCCCLWRVLAGLFCGASSPTGVLATA